MNLTSFEQYVTNCRVSASNTKNTREPSTPSRVCVSTVLLHPAASTPRTLRWGGAAGYSRRPALRCRPLDFKRLPRCTRLVCLILDPVGYILPLSFAALILRERKKAERMVGSWREFRVLDHHDTSAVVLVAAQFTSGLVRSCVGAAPDALGLYASAGHAGVLGVDFHQSAPKGLQRIFCIDRSCC
jgi:hypothetical protein